MKRRQFLQLSTAALYFYDSPLAAFSAKPSWLLAWIRANDELVLQYEKLRVAEPQSMAYGGFRDADEISNPHSTTAFIQRALWAITTPESAFFNDQNLLFKVELALKYLLKVQHPDGTIDLLSTNFHSTPDTGFLVNYLTPTYHLLKQAKLPTSDTVMALLKTFLQKAGEALVVGGIHTPNHRWVVAGALARLYELWPDARYRQRAEQWLAEHIDQDPDGQYNEKSTLVYSPLTNRVLLSVAKGFGKPELLEVIRKNLRMTMYYVHPNGEIVTETSGRQDKALVGTLEGYYATYRYFALRDNDPQMAEMCRLIEKTAGNKIASYLDFFLEDPTLWKTLPTGVALPIDYAKTFAHSGMVRIRRGEWDTTILAKNSTWLTFHRKTAVLQAVRLAASFFGKGQFQSEKIEQVGQSWLLTSTLEGPYYQPFEAAQIAPDGDWEKMPRDKRPQSEIQRLTTTVKITEISSGLQLDITLTGTDRVPVALELIFRAGGDLTGLRPHPYRSNAYLLNGQIATYHHQNDQIHIEGGTSQHLNVQLRGALAALDAPSVYMTGFTPFQQTIRIW